MPTKLAAVPFGGIRLPWRWSETLKNKSQNWDPFFASEDDSRLEIDAKTSPRLLPAHTARFEDFFAWQVSPHPTMTADKPKMKEFLFVTEQAKADCKCGRELPDLFKCELRRPRVIYRSLLGFLNSASSSPFLDQNHFHP